MALQQGSATAWFRKGRMLIAADSNTHGHWFDDHGVRRGATATDFETYSTSEASHVADEVLGKHIRAALMSSRIDRPEGWYDPRVNNWSQRLASEFGLKSPTSVYQGLRMASVFWALGAITMTPSIRRFGGGFDYYPKDDQEHAAIVIPFDSSAGIIGASLNRCIELCK